MTEFATSKCQATSKYQGLLVVKREISMLGYHLTNGDSLAGGKIDYEFPSFMKISTWENRWTMDCRQNRRLERIHLNCETLINSFYSPDRFNKIRRDEVGSV
jgi:hypothetical protein